jgi:putative transposase
MSDTAPAVPVTPPKQSKTSCIILGAGLAIAVIAAVFFGVRTNAFLHRLHGVSSHDLNELDGLQGRQVWFNFRDTKLTHQYSYLARLNYVHQNPVKHNLVPVANQYRWCSAAWFERVASPAQVKTIYAFKIDRVSVYDDF